MIPTLSHLHAVFSTTADGVIIVLSITASPVLPLITCLPVICTVTMATSFSDYVKDINLALYFVEQAPIIHQA